MRKDAAYDQFSGHFKSRLHSLNIPKSIEDCIFNQLAATSVFTMSLSRAQEKLESNKSVQKGPDRPSALENEGPSRFHALLSVLRNDDQYCDATIVVSDYEFPVHRAIVASLSPFFSKAFALQFKKASERKLVIGEASAAAMSAVLDFAYGIDVGAMFMDDATSVVEVWELAHRFEIPALIKIAGAAAVNHATVDNSVQLFRKSKLYNCLKEYEEMIVFIANRFGNVSRTKNFEALEADELRALLSSSELVATEIEKYEAVRKWSISMNTEARETHRESLLSLVRFEVMDRCDITKVLSDLNFLPKKILSAAFRRSLHNVQLIPGLFLFNEEYGYDFNTYSSNTDVEFAMTIGVLDEALRNHVAPLFFKFKHWVMSAAVTFFTDGIHLDLRFEHRFKKVSILSSLEKDVSSYTFNVLACLVTAGGRQKPSKKVKSLTQHTATENKITMVIGHASTQQDLKQRYGKENVGNMSVLVRLQCDDESTEPVDGYEDDY